MNKNFFLLIAMIFLNAMVTSCHDELDRVPLSNLAPENFFNDLAESEIVLNGIYDKMADHYQQNFIYMSDHGSHVATMLFNNFILKKFYLRNFFTSSALFVLSLGIILCGHILSQDIILIILII